MQMFFVWITTLAVGLGAVFVLVKPIVRWSGDEAAYWKKLTAIGGATLLFLGIFFILPLVLMALTGTETLELGSWPRPRPIWQLITNAATMAVILAGAAVVIRIIHDGLMSFLNRG